MMLYVHSHEVREEKADNRKCTDADHVGHLKLLVVLLVGHPARAWKCEDHGWRSEEEWTVLLVVPGGECHQNVSNDHP